MQMRGDVPPPHIEKLSDYLVQAWNSQGSMSVSADEIETGWSVVVMPALRELVGGAEDGQQIFARFSIDISKVMKAFDKRPRINFDSAQGVSAPFIILRGRVDGIKCYVVIVSEPPIDCEVSELAYLV